LGPADLDSKALCEVSTAAHSGSSPEVSVSALNIYRALAA